MNALSLREASSNLPNLVENTIKNCEETLIVTDYGAVMMIDKEYWEEIQEILALLRDKQSLAALLEGHQLREKGIKLSGKTINEVFNDL